LLAKAKTGTTDPVEIVAVMEATGMAWYPVGVYLHHQGVKVYRVNGRKTKALRHVYWKHAGSDRIDSRVLAHLYQLAPDRLSLWQPPCGDLLALQRTCREFVRWREVDVAVQNRLKAYDQWAWNGLSRLIPAKALPWVRRHWYNPWQVQQAGVSFLQDAWQRSKSGQEGQIDWIEAWVARAKEMTQLYGSETMVGYNHLQSAIWRNLDLLAQSKATQAWLSKHDIQPLYQRLFPERHLETIPGIGADSAAIYMAFIQSIERFPSIKQFRQWTGMVPASHQSGQGQSKGLAITQSGHNIIKATLYLNAQVARQWDVQLAQIYYTQMVNYGKHHSQALCACASHLANRIYALLTQNRPYQLRNLDNQPITPQRSRDLCLSQFRVPDKVRQRNTVHYRRQLQHQRTEQRFLQRQLSG
jgi:transposase